MPLRNTFLTLVILAAILGAANVRPGMAAPLEEPTSTPPGLCTITGTQTAAVNRIDMGRKLGLEITVRADCPEEAVGRADIILGLDQSSSMQEQGKFDAAKAAVRQFIEAVDFDRHQVGLMPFNQGAYIIQTLTTRTDHLFSALDAIDHTEGSTDIATAIEVADRELEADGRVEAVGILVLLTDGQSAEEDMASAAAAAADRGTVIFTIGLGDDADHDSLRRVAATPDHYYYSPGPEGLAEIYRRIAEMIRTFSVTEVRLVDRLGQDVLYVPGSGWPTEPIGGQEISWRRAFLPKDPVTVRYQVQVFRAGPVRPSAELYADYVDGDGVRRRADFTPVTVEVLVPETHTVFLPITWRNKCVPATSWADVVLVLDTSSSMLADSGGETKLNLAISAARTFLDQMSLPADQAAVVSYNATATVAQELTGDRAALQRALGGLADQVQVGTRLDLGLDAAAREFLAPGHRPENRPVIVFLSDGQQNEERERVYQAAAFARALGITVFTIALGQDADQALLRDVAGDPARSYYAPDPDDLAEIYRQVAGIVGCR